MIEGFDTSEHCSPLLGIVVTDRFNMVRESASTRDN
jgi:hypothetical protein